MALDESRTVRKPAVELHCSVCGRWWCLDNVDQCDECQHLFCPVCDALFWIEWADEELERICPGCWAAAYLDEGPSVDEQKKGPDENARA